MQTSLELKHILFDRIPFLYRIVKKILCVEKLNNLYAHAPNVKSMTVAEITSYILDEMRVKLDYNESELSLIPKTGPVIIVANHPYGGIEGITLGKVLLQLRPDVKIIANYLLKLLEPIADLFIGVDPFAKKTTMQNILAMKQAQKLLAKHGLVCVFPSGVVSHWDWKKREITDSAWSKSIARLANLTGATVVPIYFCGRNSWYFQVAGMFSSILRTMLLPQQFFARQRTTLRIVIGQNISPSRLKKFNNVDEQIEFLRLKTYLLQYKAMPSNVEEHISDKIIQETDIASMLQDLCCLSHEACLVEQKDFSVFIAKPEAIPNILREISRLREITFRSVGEGTGKEADRDEYDEHYLHLFVWHKHKQKVIGAYRLGCTDYILKHYGVEGIYVSSLYKISETFFKQIYPAIELGRAFIIEEYQRQPLPLILLWKAILRYVAKNSHYVSFYGVVSLSAAYKPLSHNLIVRFLKQHYNEKALSHFLKARVSYKPEKINKQLLNYLNTCTELSQLDELIREIEPDHKGVPILLKHYLKMEASVLDFSLDREFNNCVDCLFMNYIKDIPEKKKQYYLGNNQ